MSETEEPGRSPEPVEPLSPEEFGDSEPEDATDDESELPAAESS